MKKERILLLLAPIAAVILEALPFGAVLNFARPAEDGTIGRFRQTFSYFSLTPFGYANFGPLLTALLTCMILVMALVWCCTGRGRRAVAVLSVIAAGTSLLPLLFGISYFSWVGAGITLLLLIESFFALRGGSSR